METSKEERRRAFVHGYESGRWSTTELCQRFGITRPTGYLWVACYKEEGEAVLVDRPCTARDCPHRAPREIERRILALRKRYGWGAKKLLQVLERRYPEQVWPADFKGQFKTRDGNYCFPLTVSDPYSRKLLVCRGLGSVRTQGAKPLFRKVFREVGLPEAIRTDKGAPFASTGIHGLCELGVWRMQLGIVPQRIRPASPQENGQHERMHQDLKRETARPPAANLASQQRKFDRFPRFYNEERPHDGSGRRPLEYRALQDPLGTDR